MRFETWKSLISWYLNDEGLNPNDKAELLRSNIRTIANMVQIDFNDLGLNTEKIDVL